MEELQGNTNGANAPSIPNNNDNTPSWLTALINHGGEYLNGFANIAAATNGKTADYGNKPPTFDGGNDKPSNNDNTTLYIIGGVVALVIVYFLFIK
jgi:hypothetical protein